MDDNRGSAKVYFAQGDVQVLANSIRGFPKANSQREFFSGGREDNDLSFAKLVFHCVDGAGHAVVDVRPYVYLAPRRFENRL